MGNESEPKAGATALSPPKNGKREGEVDDEDEKQVIAKKQKRDEVAEEQKNKDEIHSDYSEHDKTMLSTWDQAIGDEEDDNSVVELLGMPLAPHSRSSKDGVYFILEKASLVVAYVGKKYQILNPEEHGSFLRRKNMNPYDFRPDIVHEALLQIMNSRLRMAGRLRAVFIRTDEGILIKVEPQTQIPKTLGSFCNMMAELLQTFSIKSKGNQGKLLRLIQNPVTQHLPVNSHKIGLSFSSPKTVKLRDFSAANCDKNLVFVVGAMAHGKIDADYIDDLISVSAYPLSVATCLRRICIALERNWKIK